MNDAQLLELVAATDAYAPGTQLPESTRSREAALHKIERSTRMDTNELTPRIETPPGDDATRGKPRFSRTLVAAAAFVLTVAVVGVVALLVSSSDETQGFGAGSSLETAAEYFAAFNAGDSDAVLALLSPNATIADSFVGSWTLSDWEMVTVWDTAQGTSLVDPDCDITAEMSQSVVLSCNTETLNAPAQAVGANPVPTHLTMSIATDGIQQLIFTYGNPDFNTVTRPFESWIWNNRQEDATRVGFGRWESAEEARQNGLLTAQYATEWAEYLDTNGCSIDDDC